MPIMTDSKQAHLLRIIRGFSAFQRAPRLTWPLECADRLTYSQLGDIEGALHALVAGLRDTHHRTLANNISRRLI